MNKETERGNLSLRKACGAAAGDVREAGALQSKQVSRAQRRDRYGDSVHKERNSGVIRVIYMILLCHTFICFGFCISGTAFSFM